MSQKILIIEDEIKIASWIKVYLEKAGYEVLNAGDGLEGLRSAKAGKPDLIILDLMLPKLKGEEVCIDLRRQSDVPIIILTAKNSKKDLLYCLDNGADDYLTKPFDKDELLSRVAALLRRSNKEVLNRLECGPMVLYRDLGYVEIGDKRIDLSSAQLSILKTFLENPNRILSRSQLIEMSFPNGFDGYERAMDNHIKRIRNLIDMDDFHPIKTVYGGGYKLEC